MPRVTLVLFPRFQMLAYVLATETLRIANKCAGRRLFEWETLSATGVPVAASNGAVVAPDRTDWSEAGRVDLVLLCAGYEPLATLPGRLRAFLARAERTGAMLGGLDTGTVVLAELGYLSGHAAVLHHEAEAGFREAWPEIAVGDSIYCLDGRRLTAAGGMATGDAMLAWIAEAASPELATATAEAMAHGVIRGAGERQRVRPSADPLLLEMQALMERHLADPLPLAAMARLLGLSPKRLRHRCRKGLGLLPSEVYLRLRLQRALDLLRGTEMPVTEVALATGFASLAGFSRTFRSRFGVTPSGVRAAARGATGPGSR